MPANHRKYPPDVFEDLGLQILQLEVYLICPCDLPGMPQQHAYFLSAQSQAGWIHSGSDYATQAYQEKAANQDQGATERPTDTELDAALKAAGIEGLKFTPLQVHAFLLKLALKDGITAKQIKLITETDRDLIRQYWGKGRK
jgi:hypothetical protein